MSQFDQLMAELDQLGQDQVAMAKALPADDGKDEEKIQAAAAEGGLEGGAAGDGDGDDKGGKPDGDGDDKGAMAKSFEVTLPDGTKVQAQDGAEMVKALTERLDNTETTMAKALGDAVNLIKGQAGLIKSLQEKVIKLSNEGRGRKAVVNLVDKPAGTPMAKSEPAGVTPDVFFAKALDAQKAGRISGTDVAYAESLLNRGQNLPEALVQRVMG